MLNSSNLLIPLQDSDKSSQYSLMNLKSLQLALPFPINSVQRPPRLVLRFMISETLYYIIFFQGLTLLIKITRIEREGNEIESPEFLALSQSESTLQIYREFERQIELAGPNRQELLRSLYFILIIYLKKKYALDSHQLALPWNFELEHEGSQKALEHANMLALSYEQRKSISYQRVLALDYDKKSHRPAISSIAGEHPNSRKTAAIFRKLPASIPLGCAPSVQKIASPASHDPHVSIARQLGSIGQENKYSIVKCNPVYIPALKKVQRKYSCDDQIIYNKPIPLPQGPTKSIQENTEDGSKAKKTHLALNPLFRLNDIHLRNLAKKLALEAPLNRRIEIVSNERLISLLRNISILHSQKNAVPRVAHAAKVAENEPKIHTSVIKNYLASQRLAITYESIKCICYPSQNLPAVPVQHENVQLPVAPVQSSNRKIAHASQSRKCITYKPTLALGYEPRLALCYKPLLALPYVPILAIDYKPEVRNERTTAITTTKSLYSDQEYEIITKNIINNEQFGDRVEIENEDYDSPVLEVASCNDCIEEIDFELDNEEYLPKDDIVYYTDKDLDEIDFEELVCIEPQEKASESQTQKNFLEDFVIVDSV